MKTILRAAKKIILKEFNDQTGALTTPNKQKEISMGSRGHQALMVLAEEFAIGKGFSQQNREQLRVYMGAIVNARPAILLSKTGF